jgi:A/G-specific adenine glycosylase
MAEQGPEHHLTVKLLKWYDANARVLPWRAVSPARMDPYKVWLSEIMLQQTTVAAVKDYFLKFIAIWPNVQALAAAPIDDVLKAWSGLGYYRRAHNLHKCAGVIVAEHGGQFPQDYKALLELPGIGIYTAGAISAIAFDLPIAAVDGNVERVISRLDAIEEPVPTSKPIITKRAQSLMPQKRAGDFVQALMDLGATVCTPKSPNCSICPWMETCEARRTSIVEVLPRKQPRKALPIRYGMAYVAIREDGAVLLKRRPDFGLLGGMMEVPGSEWKSVSHRMHPPPFEAKWKALSGLVEHTFTHFNLVISVRKAVGIGMDATPDGIWVAKEDVASEALPTVMRKILAHAGVSV